MRILHSGDIDAAAEPVLVCSPFPQPETDQFTWDFLEEEDPDQIHQSRKKLTYFKTMLLVRTYSAPPFLGLHIALEGAP